MPADDSRRGRPVYATGQGALCPTCGLPVHGGRCAAAPPAAAAKRTAKLRLETKGRGGRGVTVIEVLPADPAFLAVLARELKQTLGTGGTVRDASIELQGDWRERLRVMLAERGMRVKG